MYSVMWSEHCSYKSSRNHLGRFPSEAPWVVVGPGENAGVVDLGDGWLAALRIESHNHPSFVEPYQGAATGVGGILRDVFTMGARPIALWDQIRFGPLDVPKNRYLFSAWWPASPGTATRWVSRPWAARSTSTRATRGTRSSTSCASVIMKREQLVLGTAGAAGSVAVLLGKPTGRDGIGGASVLASASFDDESGAKRPVGAGGRPVRGEEADRGLPRAVRAGLVVGVQDLGAAGLSCATSEPAARAGMGMDVDLDAVHVRETGMTAPNSSCPSPRNG
jgi:phosphoribosylformylglycinamidine synthase subunit PurL